MDERQAAIIQANSEELRKLTLRVDAPENNQPDWVEEGLRETAALYQDTAARAREEAEKLKAENRKLSERVDYWTARGAELESEPIVGSGWVPAKPKAGIERHRDWEKAMCVLLNSTPRILAAMTRTNPKILRYIPLSLNGQRNIPAPVLTEGQTLQLAAVYDRSCEDVQERLTATDSPRRALDDAVSDVIGINQEEVTAARLELSRDPAVTNQRAVHNG